MLLNSKHQLALHLAIYNDDIKLLDAFIQFDRELLKVKLWKKGQSLLHYAVLRNANKAIEYLVEQDHNCVNELWNYGAVCQASVIDLAYEAYRKITRKEGLYAETIFFVQQQTTVRNMRLFLEYCSKDILITEKSGSVLFILIEIGAVDLIETIFNGRFKDETEFLKKFATTTDQNEQSPILVTLKNVSDSADLVKILLDHGADANEPGVLEIIRKNSDINLLRVVCESPGNTMTQDQKAELVIIVFNLIFLKIKW